MGVKTWGRSYLATAVSSVASQWKGPGFESSLEPFLCADSFQLPPTIQRHAWGLASWWFELSVGMSVNVCLHELALWQTGSLSRVCPVSCPVTPEICSAPLRSWIGYKMDGNNLAACNKHNNHLCTAFSQCYWGPETWWQQGDNFINWGPHTLQAML